MSKGNHAIQPIKTKDFQIKMKELGFRLDRISGDHYIYMNPHNETISVAFHGKEVNPMMWKVIQQRITRGNLIKTIPQYAKVSGRVFFIKSLYGCKCRYI